MKFGFRRLICTIWIFATISSLARAEDVVFFVSQANGTKEVAAGDIAVSAQAARQIEQILNLSSPKAISVRRLKLAAPQELKQSINHSINPGDRILGIVFQGHGSRRNYFLDDDTDVSGKDLANIVHESLIDQPSSRNLFVFVSACSCGINDDGQGSVQTEFLDRFRQLETQSSTPKWDEVHMVAHQDFSSNHPVAMKRVYGKFENLFYKSKIPRLLYKFDLEVYEKGGRKAFNYAAFLKAFPVALAILGAFGVSHNPHYSEIANQLLIFGGAELALGAVNVWLENSRSSWVQVKTLSRDIISAGEQSTIFSALRQVVGRSQPGLRCEDVL